MYLEFNSIRNLLAKGSYTYLCAILTVIILPFYVKFASPVLFLWFICWIFENYSEIKQIFKVEKKKLFLFISVILFYLWQVIGITYSKNIDLAFSNVFGRLSMVIFPLVLLSPSKLIREKSMFLSRLFAVSTFGYLSICFIYAFIKSVSIINGQMVFNPIPRDYSWLNYFYGSDLTINIHPTYLSIYVLLSIFIGFESFFNFSVRTIYRMGWLLLSVLLFVSLYFLSSRAAIGIAILLVPIYLLYKLFRITKKRLIVKFFLISVALFIIVVIFLVLNNEQIKNKITSIVYSEQANNKMVRDPRIIIWRLSFEKSIQNIFFGLGIGDVRDVLSKEFYIAGEYRMAQERLNAHNQYLEFLLEGGIVGLLLFLLNLTIMIYISFSDKILLYFLFIAITSLFFLFESVLYRFAGISFYYFFSFIFLNLNGEKLRSNL